MGEIPKRVVDNSIPGRGTSEIHFGTAASLRRKPQHFCEIENLKCDQDLEKNHDEKKVLRK
jgi:hypothetical protein